MHSSLHTSRRIAVPINVLYREREAGHILRGSQAKRSSLPASPPFETRAFRSGRLRRLGGFGARERSTGPARIVRAAMPAALIYTSGTTGRAKGAVMTHGNLAANARDARRVLAHHAAPIASCCALPLFHVHGLGNGVHCWLAPGCRMRLLERFESHVGRRDASRLPADAVLRRADDVRAAAGD